METTNPPPPISRPIRFQLGSRYFFCSQFFIIFITTVQSATSLNQEDEADDMSIGMEAQNYAQYQS